MEPLTGIEPANPAWKAGVLPLNYSGMDEQPELHRGRGQVALLVLRSEHMEGQMKGGRAIPG